MTYQTGGIRIENLRKVYGHGDTAVEALKSVNMQVSPGEVVGLVGPSGSGKSTLLKCLGAIIEPTSGRMTLGNEVIFEDGWKIAAVDKHLGSVYNTPKVKAQMRETMLKNGPPLNTEGGSLYKVDLPDEQIAKMLDWDKPLSQQSEGVQASLKSILGNSYKPTMTGQQAYEMASYKTMPMIMKEDGAYAQSHLRQPSASNSLRELGIPGIRYLDQGSRAGGAGTSNFVVFDPAHMNIIGRE